MKLPDWVRGMVYNLTDYFCWEKNLSARDPICLCNFLGQVCAQSFGGVTALCLLRVHPNQPWSLRCLEHPEGWNSVTDF